MSQCDDIAEVGSRIHELRERLGLAQTQFAERLGVDRKSVAGWEAGKRLPDGTSLLALMRVFGADVNYLLTGQANAAQRLTDEESTMLSYFRSSTPVVRRAAMGALLGAAPAHAAAGAIHQSGSGIHQVNTAPNAVMIGSAGQAVHSSQRRKPNKGA